MILRGGFDSEEYVKFIPMIFVATAFSMQRQSARHAFHLDQNKFAVYNYKLTFPILTVSHQ